MGVGARVPAACSSSADPDCANQPRSTDNTCINESKEIKSLLKRRFPDGKMDILDLHQKILSIRQSVKEEENYVIIIGGVTCAASIYLLLANFFY